MRPYATKYPTDDAKQRHAARSRDWQIRMAEQGKCIICGEPHNNISARTGQRARRCFAHALKFSAYARARKADQRPQEPA